MERSKEELTQSRHKMKKTRCAWAKPTNQLYIDYHDKEWGVPVYDDKTIFEFLVLESFQAGLSWEIILNKREGFKKAFDDFDFLKIASYDQNKISSLQKDTNIIRNKLKINAAVNNAQQVIKVIEEFGSFKNYIWDFVDGKPILNSWKELKQIPANTPLSDKISKELKKRGFKFMGTTVVYSHMQAIGMVNDHLVDCFRYEEVRALQK